MRPLEKPEFDATKVAVTYDRCVRKTDKAYCFKIEDKYVWIPKKCIWTWEIEDSRIITFAQIALEKGLQADPVVEL